MRYNMNGIELNDEGFQKLGEEISLDSIETKLDMPWGKENVTLFFGEVPMGESVELLVLRKGFARQFLADGKVGEVSSHPYYEVCTSPALYDFGCRSLTDFASRARSKVSVSPHRSKSPPARQSLHPRWRDTFDNCIFDFWSRISPFSDLMTDGSASDAYAAFTDPRPSLKIRIAFRSPRAFTSKFS